MPTEVQTTLAPYQQLPRELKGREIGTRQHPPLHLSVVMPLRDDWTSAAELIRRLDNAISCDACTMEILLVDDASVERYDHNDFQEASLRSESYAGCVCAAILATSGQSPLGWYTFTKQPAAMP